MDPEKLTMPGVAAVLLGLVVWLVKFTMTRLEAAIRENTHAFKNLLTALQGLGVKLDAPPPKSEPGSKAY